MKNHFKYVILCFHPEELVNYIAKTTLLKMKIINLIYLQVRRRINFEKCKAIYNEDMNRKIQLILRKNRVEPFPGCS